MKKDLPPGPAAAEPIGEPTHAAKTGPMPAAWGDWPLAAQLLSFWLAAVGGAGLWGGLLWLLAGRPPLTSVDGLWQTLYLLGLYAWLLALCRWARQTADLPAPGLWRPLRGVLAGLAISGLCLGLLFALALLLGWARPGPLRPDWPLIAGQVWLMAAGVAAIEELVFRGLMLDLALRRLGAWQALSLQALIYAGLHLLRGGLGLHERLLALLGLSLTGLLLGQLRLRSGSLGLSIGLHGGWIAITSFCAWAALLAWEPAAAIWSGGGNPIYGLSGLPLLLILNALAAGWPIPPAAFPSSNRQHMP